MDPITQGALGAACAQACLHKKDRDNAWIVGGLAGMAADLDIFINSPKNPLLFFIYHRHFTHSLLFIPLGAFLVTLVLLLFKRFRKTIKLTFLAAFIGYGTHGLLDACTSYGTLLYWPFSNTRISWDLIAIIDPFFTIPLIFGLIWTIVSDHRKGVVIGLTLAGLVLLFNTYQHHRAFLAVQSFAKQNHLRLEKLRVFPKMASSINWRAVARDNYRFVAFNVAVPLFRENNTSLIATYPMMQLAQLPQYVKKSPVLLDGVAIFNWFTDGYVILVKSPPLTLADGRFLMDDDPTISLWGLRFLDNPPRIIRISYIKLENKK
ncbi:metal-dependent hydrolase [Legionella cardiaca]|uniref:Metal-dependent hydrolase n=1 Tax=Legionella cardiaca TaxID=1071983 RepID=A0ABY8AUN0_9GAMM|nr:metal-dependent hydrolase [Legionella cardiaca]WED43456.1 metal-dependent hydrolase [Legionella cardiaca]